MEASFSEFELAGKGHTLAEWCSDCGCIHLDKLLSEQPEDGGTAGQSHWTVVSADVNL